jgi:hypothetical protein
MNVGTMRKCAFPCILLQMYAKWRVSASKFVRYIYIYYDNFNYQSQLPPLPQRGLQNPGWRTSVEYPSNSALFPFPPQNPAGSALYSFPQNPQSWTAHAMSSTPRLNFGCLFFGNRFRQPKKKDLVSISITWDNIQIILC